MKNTSVGGQAIIEGVMMRGVHGIATAIRKSNGEIIVNVEESIPYSKRSIFLGLPIIRGFVSLIESLVIGIRSLNYSASFLKSMMSHLNLTGGFKIYLEKKLKV